MFRTILFSALCVSTVALADSPHFTRASVSISSAGELDANFKIAGLGDAITTEVTLSADASAVYGCRTHSGNFPSAANKQSVAGPVLASGDFISGKNGQVTGVLVAEPPASSLICPPGQNRVVCSVNYSNVTLSSDLAGTVDLGTLQLVIFPACL